MLCEKMPMQTQRWPGCDGRTQRRPKKHALRENAHADAEMAWMRWQDSTASKKICSARKCPCRRRDGLDAMAGLNGVQKNMLCEKMPMQTQRWPGCDGRTQRRPK